MTPALSVPRRLVLTLATGLTLLGACGRDEVNGGEPIGKTSQDLVAAPQYYVGVPSMPMKQLALTFDDGPGARTSELSTYLKGQNIRAVFFVNGAGIQTTALPTDRTPLPGATTVLAQLAADGHLVANHTTTHRDMLTEVPADQRVRELSETDALITAHGKTPWNRSLFRAPYGSWGTAVYTTLSSSAMSHYVGPIYWDIGGGPTDKSANASMAADWECWDLSYTTKQCADRYFNEISTVGRGIVLMHDPYGSAPGNTVDMVKDLVPRLKAAGYTFVRADEVSRIAADFPACAVAGCVACSAGGTPCTGCAAGRYLSGGACKTCSSCPSGTYLSAACTTTTNTVCNPCDASCATCSGPGTAACTSCTAGKYLSGGACTTCTTCGPGTYPSAACTATTNTVCSACDPSCMTCSGPAPSQCGTCPVGFFLNAGGACQACTICAAGTYASAACTTTADTACTECAAGTYAPTPGATSCTGCGSCDDGDPCTTDACSATSGCTHAPIAGCGASSSGASGSGGTPGSSGSSGAPGSSGSTGTPGSSGDPSVPFDDGGDSNGDGGGGDSGCTMSRSAAPASASSVFALAALALVRRRRSGRART